MSAPISTLDSEHPGLMGLTITHPHPLDDVHEGLRRDCPVCDEEDMDPRPLSWVDEDDPTVQHEHPYADELTLGGG